MSVKGIFVFTDISKSLKRLSGWIIALLITQYLYPEEIFYYAIICFFIFLILIDIYSAIRSIKKINREVHRIPHIKKSSSE